MPDIPRPEYPRPDFQRKEWLSLNGEWEFSFDEPVYDRKILVPFCYQSKGSGIGDTTDHDVVWYRRAFPADKTRAGSGRLLLHFGAVDYHAKVWVGGVYIGEHKGGHTPFCFDITDAVTDGDNELVVMAADYRDFDKPRGKQTWRGENFACWYTPTTGIWQSVWLEYAGQTYLRRVKITPDINALQATCELFLSSQQETVAELFPTLEVDGKPYNLGHITAVCRNGYGKAVIAFTDFDFRRDKLFWSPEFPNLVDLRVVIKNGAGDDVVSTYFGMRASGTNRAMLTLNNDFRYQRLILDQGYWPDTLLTPPSDEAIIADIRLTMEMGFNGARKHQKIEDPRYYYWADKLGLLVWGELPSAFFFNDNAIENSSRELIEFVERDYNHPSIVAWVPVNESWGMRGIIASEQQRNYCRALLYLIKALDRTRPVSGNDGWEQISDTDICTVHDYSLFPDTVNKYEDMDHVLRTLAEKRILFADGCEYSGQPVVLSEYGGIAFAKDSDAGWGYYENVKDEAGFLARLEPVTTYLIRSGKFSGFCYTQLTDVMQEVNGLLTEDRKPKVSIEKLREVFSKRIY